MPEPDNERGTLDPGEPHPAAYDAKRWIARHLGPGGRGNAMILIESFASCAIEGNRLGEICGETLHRLLVGQPASDRYVLGLAWTLRSMADAGRDGEGAGP